MEVFIPCLHTSLGINSECTYLVKPVSKYKVMHILYIFLCLKSDFTNVYNFHIGFFFLPSLLILFSTSKLVLRKQGIQLKKEETQSQNNLLSYLLQK